MNCRSSVLSASLWVVVGASLVGCTSDALKVKKAEPLGVRELCAMYVASNINYDFIGTTEPDWLLCRVGHTTSATQLSEQQLNRACRPGTDYYKWAEALTNSIEKGSISIDWEAAHQCLNESRELRASGPSFGLIASEAWQALQEGPCKSFYTGTVAEGETCAEPWDCAEGFGCYSDTPWTVGGLKCLKRGELGEVCGDSHPCATGARCTDGVCIALGAANAPCTSGSDCLSGVCSSNGASDVCGPIQQAQTLKEIGQPCEAYTECAGGCVECRPLTVGAPTTCQVLGGEGDYCRDWNDCVFDLGCVANTCTASPVGTDCPRSSASTLQTVCAEGIVCMPELSCDGAANEQTCTGNNHCTWMAETETSDAYCYASSGSCIVLPETGACVNNLFCATGSYCDAGSCVMFAKTGESCSEDGGQGPLCAGCDNTGDCDEQTCSEGTCVLFCGVKEDCAVGEYCNVYAYPPACEPEFAAGCTPSIVDFDDDSECPAGNYCKPRSAEQCYAFDGDPEGCATLSDCVYAPEEEYCNPIGDCELVFGVGESCDPQLNGLDCESLSCDETPEGDYVCYEAVDGCLDTSQSSITFTWLFGMVFITRRARRKKK